MPRQYKQSRCSKCGAAIVWVHTPAGKWMPADAGPKQYKLNPEGKETLVDDTGRVAHCDTEFEGRADGWGRVPHWATCPEADSFRRARK